MKRVIHIITLSAVSAVAVFVLSTLSPAQSGGKKYDPTAVALADIAKMKVGKHDWPQWGGWTGRNNTPDGKNIPVTWDITTGNNIKWSVKLGSQTYGNPVIANGKVYVGTNNGAGYLKRYPSRVDLGCLLCFDEKTGKFLWQHSSTKLPQGRVNDWMEQGICDAPYVDGDRLWFVTSRGEVVCLDTEGFLDGENDGPFQTEQNENKDEADVVWKFDMMRRQGVFQHNMCSCSVTCWREKGILFVSTSNGVDASHINLPAPNAPSFMAMDRETGKVLWTDKSPGLNILHGQWSSPTFAILGGQPQVMFAGGDGWLYSFDPEGDGKGKSKLLWKFDCNPKDSNWFIGGRGTRNNLIATPVVYDGLVYIAVGQDPEHGMGMGHVWCIDPSQRGDVSPTLAVDRNGDSIAHRRMQAIDTKQGEKTTPNPSSAMVWHYGAMNQNEYDNQDFLEQMHRSCGTVAIKNDLLYIADFAGLVTCLNAKTGKRNWSFDMFTSSWGTPLIVEDRVYIGDELGDVRVFPLTGNPQAALKMVDGEPQAALGKNVMENAVYTTPVVANNVMFISNRNTLFAISAGGK
jgi:outer membrane protein assembly factor BamB